MEESKIRKFGYEDTDEKLEIDLYGIIFEIKDIDNVKKIENIDRNDKNVVEEYLKKILGDDCIQKINTKRKSDGYSELTLIIELNILGCIFEVYGEKMANSVLKRVANTANMYNNNVNNFKNNFNREQRRNYNKYNRGYKNRGY